MEAGMTVARQFGENLRAVRRQAGLSQEEVGFRASLYSHVFDEFDIAERVSAEDQIAQAWRDVSGLCPPCSAGTRGIACQSQSFSHANGEKQQSSPTTPSICQGSPS
jgi:hypothetical protein